MAVLIGHCSEQDEAVPYLPFVEILERWVDGSASPYQLCSQLGAEGPELSRLLPKLRRIMPDLAPPLKLPPPQARRHLFNSFCDFVARHASEMPTLLILEDLHWSDTATLSLLLHLANRLSNLQVAMIATYRDAEADMTSALAKTLENLIRGRNATQIGLKGLTLEEVGQMLKGLSQKDPPPAVVNEIYAETQGNPFFVEELARYLIEENRLYDEAGEFNSAIKISEFEVPQSVRLVVGPAAGPDWRARAKDARDCGSDWTLFFVRVSGGFNAIQWTAGERGRSRKGRAGLLGRGQSRDSI